jgi:hypothetical protein
MAGTGSEACPMADFETGGAKTLGAAASVISSCDSVIFLFFPPLPRKLTPLAVQCGMEGCTNMKKYCCSQTGMQLCSLDCYRKNIARIRSLC